MKIKEITVSQLNSYIKRIMVNDPLLSNVRVSGEVSNFKIHSSGNVYLTLKDQNSKIRAVIFKKDFDRQLDVREGSKVIANGTVSTYERDGSYQLYINKLDLDGEGDLFTKFNELKKKLEKNGLFSTDHKKPMPKFPKAIGVVTSDTGAVIRDIINVIKRRYPKVHIKLYPSIVQGPSTAKGIIDGIKFFNGNNNVDLIIIGRGGGSIEELWGFNDEELAYAIYDSLIPIISAVGHETDFTIADFVADLRAPTPSAAAELATPSLKDLIKDLESNKNRLARYINSLTDINKVKLDRLFDNIIQAIEDGIIRENLLNIDKCHDRLELAIKNYLQNKQFALDKTGASLAAINPLSTLARGFSIIEKDGKILKSSSQVELEDKITVDMVDGTLACKVIEKKERTFDGEKNYL